MEGADLSEARPPADPAAGRWPRWSATSRWAATFAEGFRRAMRRAGAARDRLSSWPTPRRRTMTIEAIHGISAEEFRPRYGVGVGGRVAESGRPIVVPMVRQEPMALAELADPAAWHRRSPEPRLAADLDSPRARARSPFTFRTSRRASRGDSALLQIVAAAVAPAIRERAPARGRRRRCASPASAGVSSTRT